MKKIKNIATIAFYNPKKGLLFQERGDYSKVGEEWAFFGGSIEEGETHIEGFFREAREELGIDMKDFPYIYIGENIQETEDKISHRYVYLIKTDLEEKDFTVFEGSGCKYFNPIEAKKLKFPSNYDELIDFIVSKI